MKFRFIVNARSGAAAKALPLVRSFAGRHGAEIAITQRPGHGAELAAQALADGCDLVVAVGGDGTMNEVGSALIGTHAVLGLIPCGSGDGLGRHLGIHGPVPRALDLLLTGAPRTIDTGTANGHPFFTAAGFGFEAEIAHRFNQLQRRGFLRYLTTSAKLFWSWKPQRCTFVHPDGTRDTIEAFTVAVANADQYGNDARIAPRARADDGLLDLTIVPPVSVLNGARLLWRLFAGTLPSARGIVTRQFETCTIERETSGWFHTDGELHQEGKVIEFKVRPASLRIMAPQRG